jgi:hemoglobin/transferrin/lactoferrin receptor protein
MMHSITARYYGDNDVFDHLVTVLAYQDYEESRHDRNLNNNTRNNQLERVQAFTLNTDFDKRFHESLSIFYGAEIVTNKVSSASFTTNIVSGENMPASTRYPDGATWDSYALYVGTKIRLSSKWLLNLNNRFTSVITKASFDTTFYKFPFTNATLRNKATNSILGLIFTPTQNWKLYSNFSTGFRAPNVDDIGKVFDSGDGNVIVPNPDLESEYAYNLELGVAGSVSKGVQIETAIYYTTMDNAIARGFSAFKGGGGGL